MRPPSLGWLAALELGRELEPQAMGSLASLAGLAGPPALRASVARGSSLGLGQQVSGAVPAARRSLGKQAPRAWDNGLGLGPVGDVLSRGTLPDASAVRMSPGSNQ